MYTLTLRILLSACLWTLPCLPLAAQGADPARIVPADERTDVYLPLLEDDTPQDTTAAGSSVNEEQSTTGAAQNSGNEKSPATGAQNTAVWMAAGAAAVIALSGFGLAARRKTQTQK